jgi:hypothetical protein
MACKHRKALPSITLDQPVDVRSRGLFDMFEGLRFGGEAMLAPKVKQAFEAVRIVRTALREANRADINAVGRACLRRRVMRGNKARGGTDVIPAVRTAHTFCHIPSPLWIAQAAAGLGRPVTRIDADRA